MPLDMPWRPPPLTLSSCPRCPIHLKPGSVSSKVKPSRLATAESMLEETVLAIMTCTTQKHTERGGEREGERDAQREGETEREKVRDKEGARARV